MNCVLDWLNDQVADGWGIKSYISSVDCYE